MVGGATGKSGWRNEGDSCLSIGGYIPATQKSPKQLLSIKKARGIVADQGMHLRRLADQGL